MKINNLNIYSCQKKINSFFLKNNGSIDKKKFAINATAGAIFFLASTLANILFVGTADLAKYSFSKVKKNFSSSTEKADTVSQQILLSKNFIPYWEGEQILKQKIHSVAGFSEEIGNTWKNLNLENEQGKSISISHFASAEDFQEAFKNWKPPTKKELEEGKYSDFQNYKIQKDDIGAMIKLHRLATDDSHAIKAAFQDFFEGKKAKKEGRIYISSIIVQAMKYAKTPADKAAVVDYAIAPALESFYGGKMVNPEILQKLLKNEDVISSNMQQALIQKFQDKNNQAIHKLKKDFVWDCLKGKMEKADLKELMVSLDQILAEYGHDIKGIKEALENSKYEQYNIYLIEENLSNYFIKVLGYLNTPNSALIT